jgi:hypothetical protein
LDLKNKLTIVHFQPVEGYPPVMNVINSMVVESFETQIISTQHRGGDWFVNSNSEVLRIGKSYGSVINRCLCYLQFAIIGFWKLLEFKPKAILIYESYSVLPVFLYSIICPKVNLLIHYHEFVSKDEMRSASAYSKFLYFLEKRLLTKAIWVSQTNIDRKIKFQALFPQRNEKQLRVFPNYPSKTWAETGIKRKTENAEIVKFIHVGSLGIETTYISEFVEWIQSQNGRATLTVISQNLEQAVIDVISQKHWVTLIRDIPYQELPKMIVEHHVGVVLYKGHVPNFVYNVPNKVNECLACGLSVWYSDVLISTQKFAAENPQYPLFSVDFSRGENLLAPEYSSEPFEFKHWNEDAVQPLIASIKQAMDSSLNTF